MALSKQLVVVSDKIEAEIDAKWFGDRVERKVNHSSFPTMPHLTIVSVL
jgi:hypothetical protein